MMAALLLEQFSFQCKPHSCWLLVLGVTHTLSPGCATLHRAKLNVPMPTFSTQTLTWPEAAPCC